MDFSQAFVDNLREKFLTVLHGLWFWEVSSHFHFNPSLAGKIITPMCLSRPNHPKSGFELNAKLFGREILIFSKSESRFFGGKKSDEAHFVPRLKVRVPRAHFRPGTRNKIGITQFSRDLLWIAKMQIRIKWRWPSPIPELQNECDYETSANNRPLNTVKLSKSKARVGQNRLVEGNCAMAFTL